MALFPASSGGSRFAVVDGTTPSAANTIEAVALFPTGFTGDNCAIIGYIVKNSNANWYSYFCDNINQLLLFTTSGVGIRGKISDPSSPYLGQPIKVILMRVDL